MSSAALLPSDLLRYAPGYVARRLARSPGAAAGEFAEPWSAATLFADISGFTPLAERMAARGAQGAEELSQILNAFFGTLIDAIDAHGADIARFAGDAVLAYWPLDGDEGLADAAQLAAQCAAEIQERMRAFQSPAGERLSVRAGVGAGRIYTISLGGVRGRYECMVTGPGVIEATRAAAAAQPGTVAVGAHAWSLLASGAKGEVSAGGPTRLAGLSRRVTPRPYAWPELPPEAAPALAAYVPASIRRRLEAHQSAWLAEIRHISVIFVNLPRLTDQVPLEMAQRVIRAIQEALYRFEGSVNKLGADEKGAMLTAALGLPPLSHEDDEARAALAGLDVLERLTAMGVEASVGVNAGTVFCGTIGNRIRCEYSIQGDAVNLAARLMSAAHGGVLCAESIHRKAAARLEWEVLPPIRVKGKSAPVGVFRPIAEAVRGRAARPLVPMVGRDPECARIHAVFARLEDEGRGGVVVLEGQAGIGKSRVVTAVVDAAAERALGVCCGFAEAVQATTPYYAFRAVFHRLLDLERAAGDRAAQRELVIARLSFDPLLVELAPLLEVVLALDFPDNEITATLFGEARVNLTNELLVRLVARAAAERPLVLVLEDGHWMDPSSWALAAQLCRAVEALVVVVAARPLADTRLKDLALLAPGPRFCRIALEPLSSAESLELVKLRLGVDELPAAMAQVLHARAQGNPFFTVELAFELAASGQVQIDGRRCALAPGFDPRTVNLPETVQGVVVSRIDRLEPPQQLTLKVASVVGRSFSSTIVRDVCPIPEDRPEQLANLCLLTDHQFVDLETTEPELVYNFHHVITQEVAYQLMMPAQRRALHGLVAEWYEGHCADLEPFYPLLAKHWANADQRAKALEYLAKSGKNALRDHANREAAEFFTQALALDAMAAEVSDRRRRGSWERMLAEATYNLGQLDAALLHYQKALELLGHPFPKTALGFVVATLWQLVLQLLHRLRPAAFLGTAGEDGAAALEASRAYERLVQVRYLNSATVETLHAAFAGLNIAETVGDSAELARSQATAAVMSGLLRMHGAARRYARRAQEVADTVQHKPTGAYVAFVRGLYWVTVGDWDQAEADLTLGARLMKEMGDRRHWAETTFTLAQALSRRGELARSLELAVELAAAGRQRGTSQVESWGLSWRIWCLLALEPESAELAEAARALSAVLETGTDLSLADRILGFGMVSAARWKLGEPLRAVLAARAAGAIIREASPVSQYLLCGYSGMVRVYFERWLATNDPGLRDEMEALAASLCRTLSGYCAMYPVGTPRLYLARGHLAWMRGQPDRARRQWTWSAGEAQRRRMPYEAMQAHEVLAHHAARAERDRHRAQADALGARWRRHQ